SPGQVKPAHSRYAPHHRHEGGEHGFHRYQFTDDRHPSKDSLQVPNGCGQPNIYHLGYKCKVTRATSTTPILQAHPPVWCENNMSKCTTGPKQMVHWNQLEGNTIVVDGSRTSSNNIIIPCLPGSHTDGKHISGGGSCNPTPMGGIPKHKHKRQWRGAASQAAAVRNAQAQALRAKLRQLEAPRPPSTTYRAVENRGKALFGRSPNSYKVDANAMRQAEQRNLVTQMQINNVRKKSKPKAQQEQKRVKPRIPGRVTQQYTDEPKSVSPGLVGRSEV
ncbi:hypothetical protein M378DRAFT_969618, partial [Amanita muscaria Koide BX008]